MSPLFLTNLLLESEHKYGFIGIDVPDGIAGFLQHWGELNIPDDMLAADGREDETHVTVKYGLLDMDMPYQLTEIAHETPAFPILIGKISLFSTAPEFDVVKLDVESPGLRALNQKVSTTLPHEDKHDDYNPHVTIAYVQKGSCDHLVDEDPLAQEGAPERAFIAGGMGFRGAGIDSDQPPEMLLFSKVKSADAVMAEAKTQEEEPFNKIGFPTDSNQTEKFRRKNYRRKGRQVL